MRKRISKYKHLHSNRFRYLSSSIPLACASGLLLVAGVMVNPIGMDNRTLAASIGEATNPGGGGGGDTDETSVELTVTQPTLSKPSTAGVVNYISTGLSVTAKKVDTYNIVVQATEDATGKLVGETTGAEIKGVGSNVATNAFTDDSWGYALAEGSVETAGLESLAYNTVPENGQGATTPAYSQKVKDEAVAGKDFTLAFAAKFGNNTKADHYRSNVLVSVAVNPEELVVFNGITRMDQMTPEICRNAKENDTAQLIDDRDGTARKYWVTKLKDGNCWMTQNLDYDDPNSIRIVDVAQWTGTSADYRVYYDPGIKIAYNGSLQDVTEDSDTHKLAGNYYSWAAAANGTSQDMPANATASESICPAKWRLPTGGKGEYGKLFSGLGTDQEAVDVLFTGPYYFVLAGVPHDGNLAGADAFYWTSTLGANNNANYIYLYTGGIILNNTGSRYYGGSIRCLMPSLETAETLASATYMQEVTSETCSKTTTIEQQKQLIDYRDGKTYWVAKLKDGNCWMTQNLDYDGGGTRVNALNDWKDDNTVEQYYDPGMKVGNGDGANVTSTTDTHTLAGNYYSWLAVTNETGAGMTSGEASGSICPADWQLPTGNMYKALLDSVGDEWADLIQISPYYFQKGGRVSSGELKIDDAGWYWSSSSHPDGHSAIGMSFYDQGGSKTIGFSRFNGLFARCLVTGL